MSAGPFRKYARELQKRKLHPRPVPDGGKGSVKHWNKPDAELPEGVFDRWLEEHAPAGIGILTGTPFPDGTRLAVIDIDRDDYVPLAQALFRNAPCARVGQKGIAIFVRLRGAGKSRSYVVRLESGERHHVADLLCEKCLCVIPPTTHPVTRQPYRWIGRSLLEVTYEELPLIDAQDPTSPDAISVRLVEALVTNRELFQIVSGGPGVKAHDLMLRVTSSGIANFTSDQDLLETVLRAAFHTGYGGDTPDKIKEMLQSARSKGLGAQTPSALSYDPGTEGPVPMGYTQEGYYALLDNIRQIIVLMSSNQLLSAQCLIGLAPSHFWGQQFPAEKAPFHAARAGEALIDACRAKGPFFPYRVRGRGVWLEDSSVITNLGDPVTSSRYHYVCFAKIELGTAETIDARRVLSFFSMFNWRHPQDAMLLLGWLAIAPICGALRWRPHVFIYGPARAGKTTIHTVILRLLSPLVVAADGQSTEAGIRQTLGPDSLPTIIDEFESDQGDVGIRRIIRLARSASSAETSVLRGTPEGKAMSFSLRTTFLFAAINPRGMSAADQSRILMLELLMHDNDRTKAEQIVEEEVHFRSKEHAWPALMIELAHLVPPAIDAIDAKIATGDRRHRQNMATLLGGAFVALHARVPTEDEAAGLAEEYRPLIEGHAADADRDDASECLERLLHHVVEGYPLGHWIAAEYQRLTKKNDIYVESRRMLGMFDMVLRVEGDEVGLFIRNGSAPVDKALSGTQWGQGAWQRALRKLPGVYSPKHPVQFPIAGKCRCLAIPLDLLPTEPLERADLASRI